MSRYVDYRAMFSQATSENNIPMMEQALPMLAKDERNNLRSMLGSGLYYAAKHNHTEMIQFLLDNGANMADMSQIYVPYYEQGPTIQTLQFLVDNGWDINHWGNGKDDDWRKPFLWTCLSHQSLVDWCLEHGARVDIYDERLAVVDEDGWHEGDQRHACPPLLDYVATYGTVAQFQLFRSRGAPLGFRMLHNAVQRAVYAALRVGVTEPPPADDTDDEDRTFHRYRESMAMVRHILTIKDVDVNAKSVAVGDSCATALCLVAFRPTKQNYRPLTRLLLDAGADPDLEAFYRSPRSCGELQRNRNFMEALDEWEKEKREEKEKQEQEQTSSSV